MLSLQNQAPLTLVCIHKTVRRDRVLEISDSLSLEPSRSRIRFSVLEINERGEATATVKHYADAAAIKLVCWDMLNGHFYEWVDHGGRPDIDKPTATTLAIRRDNKYRQPFVLKIDNGDGEALSNGTVKMVEVKDSLTILLNEVEGRILAQTVLDYIRDWETVNFRRRQEAQTVILPSAGEGDKE